MNRSRMSSIEACPLVAMPKKAMAADQTIAPPIANRARQGNASPRMFPQTSATALIRLCVVSAHWSFICPPLFGAPGALSCPESCGHFGSGTRRFHFAVARLCGRHERPDERAGRRGDFFHCVIEYHLIGLGR